MISELQEKFTKGENLAGLSDAVFSFSNNDAQSVFSKLESLDAHFESIDWRKGLPKNMKTDSDVLETKLKESLEYLEYLIASYLNVNVRSMLFSYMLDTSNIEEINNNLLQVADIMSLSSVRDAKISFSTKKCIVNLSSNSVSLKFIADEVVENLKENCKKLLKSVLLYKKHDKTLDDFTISLKNVENVGQVLELNFEFNNLFDSISVNTDSKYLARKDMFL